MKQVNIMFILCGHLFSALSLSAIVSEIGMLAAAVGGSCAVILVILGIIMGVKFYKKRQEDMDIEEHSMGKTDLY